MAKNDFRVALFLRLSLGFVWEMLSFVGKHLRFHPKVVCLFNFCIFCLNEKEFNQQVCLIKYAENEMSNSTSHKRKKKKERSKNIVQLQKHF